MDGANDAVAAGETVTARAPARRRRRKRRLDDRGSQRAPSARRSRRRRPRPAAPALAARAWTPSAGSARRPRLGPSRRLRARRWTGAPTPSRRWTSDWRHDRRYDWRDWRHRHRNRFHLGFYFDPFGWDYFRYGIGWRLWPSYYRSSYWLHDPWQYRLPPAYGPYRWIRYHNDALLVNIYTGNVVDVIYDFFW